VVPPERINIFQMRLTLAEPHWLQLVSVLSVMERSTVKPSRHSWQR
jgi:hypothetical protein